MLKVLNSWQRLLKNSISIVLRRRILQVNNMESKQLDKINNKNNQILNILSKFYFHLFEILVKRC